MALEDNLVKNKSETSINVDMQNSVTESSTHEPELPAIQDHQQHLEAVTDEAKQDYFRTQSILPSPASSQQTMKKEYDDPISRHAVEESETTPVKGEELLAEEAGTVHSDLNETNSTDTSSSIKKAPGWKGWLRSASSSNVNVFRLDLNRKSAMIEPQLRSNTVNYDATHQLSETLNFAKGITEGLRESDALLYDAIMKSDRPRDSHETAQVLRAGILDQVRGILWQHAAESKNIDLEGVYFDLRLDSSACSTKQIQKDLSRMNRAWVKRLEKTPRQTPLEQHKS